MNKMKSLTVIAILAVACAAQAETLFDSAGSYGAGSAPSATAPYKVIGGSILGQNLSSGYNVFTFDSISINVLDNGIPGSEGTLAIYGNDKLYSIGGKEYAGPGTLITDVATFAAGHEDNENMINTVSYNFAAGSTYTDYYKAGVTVLVTSEDGISLPFSNASEIYTASNAAGALGYDTDFWYGSSMDNLTLGAVSGENNPFSMVVDGTVTLVPEAGTMQLALMGLAAIGGFAGLRRFKRD